MEPPSTRPWLGVGAALSALPAAGGCFCAALLLAVIADSDPGAVYEQHRWLGAVVAASAACAYVAMMGWATLRHGGLPALVLLIALALSGVPFLLPGALFLPAVALVVAGSAALATAGVRHPPPSPDGTRVTATALTATAIVLAVAQAIAVDQVGATRPARAQVLAEGPKTSSPARPGGKEATRAPAEQRKSSSRAKPGGKEAAPAPAEQRKSSSRAKPGGKEAAPAPARADDESSSPARPGGTDAARAPAEQTESSSPAKPGGKEAAPAPAAAPDEPVAAPPPITAPDDPAPGSPAPADLAPPPVTAAARAFVRDYYAALDAHDFTAAWKMLAPDVRRAFGGFGPWRKGYARTISHAPGGLRVTAAGTGATVGLTLRAGDRGACGKVAERRFAVTWRLARTAAGLRATAATARKLSGPEPC